MLAAFKAAVFLQRDAGALRHFFFGKADDLAHGANALRHLCELCFQVCFFPLRGFVLRLPISSFLSFWYGYIDSFGVFHAKNSVSNRFETELIRGTTQIA